ncbi:MAG TPA: hypothetical protein VGM54_09745 [Chthoniobacter sp.]|jgi:hypothetical protein
MKIWLLILLASCFRGHVCGDEAAPAARPQYVRTWKFPPDLIPRTVDGKPGAREWFEANGVNFSPSDEIIADSSGNIVMRAEKVATLDLVDAILGGEAGFPEPDLRVEVSLVEIFTAKPPKLDGPVSYAALRRAAKGSWRILNQIELTTVPGQRSTAISKIGVAKKMPAKPVVPLGQWQVTGDGPLPPNQRGASLEVEPVAGPDGKTIDVNLNYHYRGPGVQSWDTKPGLTMTLENGVPKVVQVEIMPENHGSLLPARLRALIVRTDVVIFKEPTDVRRQGAPPSTSTVPAP